METPATLDAVVCASIFCPGCGIVLENREPSGERIEGGFEFGTIQHICCCKNPHCRLFRVDFLAPLLTLKRAPAEAHR